MSRKKLITIIAVCIVVVIVALAISLSKGDPVVNFADSRLEIVIREALNRTSGSIYVSELAGLTRLEADYRGVEDISVLQYCTNLTYLELDRNQISDISPLANLTNLTYLRLSDNQISDISPLVENEELGGEVDLWDNPLSDDSINIYIPQLEARGVAVWY